jgi:hypothetical protein
MTTTQTIDTDALLAQLEALRAENDKLRTQPRTASPLTLRVSEKGALSVYGMGRFPVTLYREQWTKLLGYADQIREFIRVNDASLATKQ